MMNSELDKCLDELIDQMLEAKDWLRGAESASDVRAGDVLLKSARKALNQLIAEQVRLGKIEELQKYVDQINNYKPDPTAPSFGSASGAFETAGWKHTFEDRISALQSQGDKK